MLDDSINIDNRNWNPLVMKKVVMPPKITILWPSFHNNGVPMGYTQNKKTIFFAEITNQIISFQKLFILSKYMFWLSY